MAWPVLWVAAVALEVLAGGVAIWLAGQHGPALLAVVLNALVCARFAATLRPGAEPLITQYGRFDRDGLPPECEGYTRALTVAWTVLIGAFSLAHAVPPLLGLGSTAMLSKAQGAIMLAFFLGEHVLRNRRFPHLGPATPWRTLRAMWLSLGARHA
ncbi:MAG TPA: hypothetical protein VE033_06755 [Acetobacteraceae bacterium]|jgi:uncharacterized membrane protein|nr:hypothetical protein [Acetobacteraceae bacterium]